LSCGKAAVGRPKKQAVWRGLFHRKGNMATSKMEVVKLRITVNCTVDVDIAGRGRRTLAQMKKLLSEDLIDPDTICDAAFRSPDAHIGPSKVGKAKITIVNRKQLLDDDGWPLLDSALACLEVEVMNKDFSQEA
jgi:hypothetical protein